MLSLHLLSALGGLAPLAFFLDRHWWIRRHKVGGHSNAWLGYIALASLAALVLSGTAMLWWTNVAVLRELHNGAMLVLLVDLGLHMAWRVRYGLMQRLKHVRHMRGQWRPVLQWLAIGVVVAGVLGVVVWVTQPASPTPTATIPLAHACHSDVTQQWHASAHAHAAGDAYYQSLVALFIQERGVDSARYCAACHNPIGLMQGEVDTGAARKLLATGAGNAYESRATKLKLPISAHAAESVTCVVCHQAAPSAQQPGNGSLNLNPQVSLPASDLARLALRAAPEGHKDLLRSSALEQAQLCGSCHNLRLPDDSSGHGLVLEPTYEEWLDSPYRAQGVTCQACHMPATTGRKVDSDLPQSIRTHGGLPGAPSSLPEMASDPS